MDNNNLTCGEFCTYYSSGYIKSECADKEVDLTIDDCVFTPVDSCGNDIDL